MGCGASGQVTVPGPGGAGALLFGQRRLSLRPHSLETRILQVETVDTMLQDRPSHRQSEAPFDGPQLGVGDLSAIRESIGEGAQFVDTDFPAEQSSLGHRESVRWLRSRELGVQDRIWTGKTRGKIRVGGHHSSWIAEALAIASTHPWVLDKVFVEEHVTRGYVILRLWRFGKWETVTIDDRIPVPYCITSTCPDEVWPAIIEKAFAKLHGSYAALAGGDILWGLEDLTGGIAQRLELPPPALSAATVEATKRRAPTAARSNGPQAPHSVILRTLRQALQAGAIISCKPNTRVQQLAEKENSISIVLITDVRRNQNGSDVRVRDDVIESADSEWRWIDIKDFVTFYTSIIVTTFQNEAVKVQTNDMYGQWEVGISSGGSRNNLEKFAMNPQFILTVKQSDFSADGNAGNKEELHSCSLLIALMQEHRRSSKHTRPPLLPIACFIYKAELPNERLSAEYFLCVSEEASTGTFSTRREVALQVELEPGHYVLIPATWSAHQNGAFLLRVYALKEFAVNALPQHSPNCAMLPTWVPVTEV